MWLFYALLGPPFWAFINILDSHCVGNVFDRPWVGVVTGALATSLMLLAFPFVLPYVEWELPEWHFIGLALLIGVLIQVQQAFFFQALEKTEGGIIAAYENLTPTLLPLASYYFMGDVLQPWHYITIGVLVITSLCFAMIDVSRNGRWDSIILMVIACSIQVVAILMQKYVFEHASFVFSFMLILIGIVITGLMPLLATKTRRVFVNNVPKLKPLATLFIAIEFANVFALYLGQKAVDLGSPAMSAAMNGTVPAYSFLFTFILLQLKHKYADENVRFRLRTKLLLVGIMSAGVMQIA